MFEFLLLRRKALKKSNLGLGDTYSQESYMAIVKIEVKISLTNLSLVTFMQINKNIKIGLVT